jgi:hypothetical protein
LAAIASEAERALVEFDFDDDVLDDLCADMLRLRAHLLHQPRALDDVGEARIVLDIRGDGELAARLQPRDQQRFAHGARRIDGGGVAGGTGADDDDGRMAGDGF